MNPTVLLMEIFQDFSLSVQLFNIVWNIAVDMINLSPDRGYNIKEAGIKKHQFSYVDVHTVFSDSLR